MSSDDRQREILLFVDRLLSDPAMKTAISERLSSMATVDGVVQSTLNRILKQWVMPAILIGLFGLSFAVLGLKSIQDVRQSVQQLEIEARAARDTAVTSATKASEIAGQLSFTPEEIRSINKFNDELQGLRRAFGADIGQTLVDNLLARPSTRELSQPSEQLHVNVKQLGFVSNAPLYSLRDELRAELPRGGTERTVWLTVSGEMKPHVAGTSASKTFGFYLLSEWRAVDPNNFAQAGATRPLGGALHQATTKSDDWTPFTLTSVALIPKGDFFVIPGLFGNGDVNFKNLTFTVTTQPLVTTGTRQ